MADWQVRKQVGDAHERRVHAELRARGWDVTVWGLGALPPAFSADISHSGSRLRYCPDLLAHRRGDLVAIDCKDSMRQIPRYSIKRECLEFGMQFCAAFKTPLLYVFGNLGVLTPAELQAYPALVGPPAPTGAYVLVDGNRTRNFDDVFGLRTYAAAS